MHAVERSDGRRLAGRSLTPRSNGLFAHAEIERGARSLAWESRGRPTGAYCAVQTAPLARNACNESVAFHGLLTGFKAGNLKK
jgi:hypothetical protein